jgi:hypothetical protein
VVLFLTDQERAVQHFPPGWVEANLPGFTRLKKNGLSFTRAFTNACMCTPARTTLLTGYLPAQVNISEPPLCGHITHYLILFTLYFCRLGATTLWSQGCRLRITPRSSSPVMIPLPDYYSSR